MKRTLKLTHLESRLTPAIATWDGGGADNHWTTPANWVGDVAPNPGDDLVSLASSVNDLPAGTSFRSMAIGLSGTISGNPITISSGISVDARMTPVISLGVILGGDQSFSQGDSSLGFTISGDVDLNGHVLTLSKGSAAPGGPIIPPSPSLLTMSGTIHGAGRLTKEGVGIVVLRGNNTYAGITDIRDGTVHFASNNAAGAAGAGNGTIVEAAGRLSVSDPFLTYQQMTIAEPITFAPIAATNSYQFHSFADVDFVTVPNTFTGLITLTGPSQWQANDLILANGLSGTGNLSITSGGLKFGAGSVNTFTGQLINNPRVVFDGTGPFSPLSVYSQSGDGATVSGTGTIGPLATAGVFRVTPGESSFVPGDSGIGTLTTGNLNSAGILEIQVGAAGADQVAVHVSVQLSGSLRVLGAAGFTPTPGARYRIIDNDGTDAINGIFAGLNEGTVAALVGGRALKITYRGGDGNDVELIDAGPVGLPSFAVAAGPGIEPRVSVYGTNGGLVRSFLAYDAAFRGGVHVAVGDVTGDGVPDIVTAPCAGGGPVVRVFNIVTGAMERQWLAYDAAFVGGVFIAIGGVLGANPGFDVVTGAGPGGGPHVKVFQLAGSIGEPYLLEQWMAYDPNFRGGVTVAAGDLDGNNRDDVITGPGAGGGPHVRTFSVNVGNNGIFVQPGIEFFAYAAEFTGGIFVASGDFNHDGHADIITSPGVGGGPVVRVFNGTDGSNLANFLAYDPIFRGGVTVAAVDLDGDGRAEIITGAGPGGGPHLKILQPNGKVRFEFLAFDPAFTGGIYVG
jgi:autotransporter-associated beta strand protein